MALETISMPARGDKVFIDTNILVYAHDREAGAKQALAATILDDLWERRTGVVSMQVLQEFYVTVTQKIPRPLATKIAVEILQQYRYWEIAPLQPEDLFSAIALQKTYHLAFWDALIIQAAINAGCDQLLTEDMGHKQHIHSLMLCNPFRV